MKLKTPFTKKEIDKLNEYQSNPNYHPYTCLNDGDKVHIDYEFQKRHPGEDYDEYIKKEKAKGIPYPEMEFNETILVATENGWVCPVCNYTQNWANLL